MVFLKKKLVNTNILYALWHFSVFNKNIALSQTRDPEKKWKKNRGKIQWTIMCSVEGRLIQMMKFSNHEKNERYFVLTLCNSEWRWPFRFDLFVQMDRPPYS